MKRLKGIYTNSNLKDQPEGYYRDALNINIDESAGSITNEKGTELLFELSAGESIKGSCLLPDGRSVFFISGATDRIALFDNNVLTNLTTQNFEFGDSITTVPYINQFNEPVVFWVDGVNPARFINIEDPDKAKLIHYNLFPATDNIPEIKVTAVNSGGGSLEAGTYYIAAAYIHKDSTITDFYTISNPIYITSDGEIGTRTSKSITFELSDVDSNYETVQIAVIQKKDGIFDEVQLLPELGITTTVYTYSGNESYRPGALEEVQIDSVKYLEPKAIAYDEDNLFLGNMRGRDYINFQGYANKIRVQSVTKRLTGAQEDSHQSTSNSALDPLIASTLKGYRRGEVYAFYISLLLKDGTQTRAYHIPGRTAIESLGGEFAVGSSTFASFWTNEFVPATTAEKATSEDITVITQIANEGNAYIRFNNQQIAVLLFQSDSRADIATRLVNAINAQAAWDITAVISPNDATTFKIEANATGEALNGQTISFGFEDNVDTKRTFVTGQSTNRYDENDPAERYDIDFSYERILSTLKVTLEDGSAAGTLQVTIDIDTDALTHTYVLSLTAGSTVIQTATAIRDFLNAQANFSTLFTASLENTLEGLTVWRTDLKIQADAIGPTYNGVVSLDFSWGANNNIVLGGGLFNNVVSERAEFFEDVDAPNKKQFQFISKPDPVYGMGYWENENEKYPDTEAWITAGAGGEDLRNQPVRHHQFPDPTNSPYIDEVGAGIDHLIQGFKLVNVEIPAELQDEVIGYKVYYAKRTEENKRIIDSVVPIPATVIDGVYTPSAVNRTKSIPTFHPDPVFYTHPFTLMRNKTNVGSLTHLKLIGNYGEDPPLGFQGVSHSSLPAGQFAYGNRLWDALRLRLSFDDAITTIKVEHAAYAESEGNAEEGVNLGAFGFTRSLNNFGGESKLILQLALSSPLTQALKTTRRIANLCSHKAEVYNSFDQQILVDTGYIHKNMVTLDSADIFGGDTFITPYFYRTVRRRDSEVTDIAFRHATVESTDNINYRLSGANPWEIFFPKIKSTLWTAVNFSATGEPRSKDSDVNYYDNYIGYRDDYSAVNDIKFPGIYPKILKQTNNHVTRIIRNSNSIRNFLQDDFIDLNRKRGKLIKLAIYNNILIPHMERALVRTKGKEDLQIGDIRAFVGSGDIFNTPPSELIYADEGFAGIQNKNHSISTPFGYYFYDNQARRFYSLTNDGIRDLTEPILPQFRIFEGNIHLGYNPYNERIHFCDATNSYSYSPKIQGWASRHSYIPDRFFHDLQFMYSAKGLGFYCHDIGNPGEFYGSIYDTTYTYIKNTPDSRKATSLFIDTDVYLPYNYKIVITDSSLDFSSFTISAGGLTASNIALIANDAYTARLIASVLANEVNAELNAKAYSEDNVIYIYSNDAVTISASAGATIAQENGSILNKWSTFDKYQIKNSSQDSGISDIVYFKNPIEDELENLYIGNARKTMKYWVINSFRDVTSVPDDIDAAYAWAYSPRLEDRYHSIHLIKDNKFREDLVLVGSDLIDKTSIR